MSNNILHKLRIFFENKQHPLINKFIQEKNDINTLLTITHLNKFKLELLHEMQTYYMNLYDKEIIKVGKNSAWASPNIATSLKAISDNLVIIKKEIAILETAMVNNINEYKKFLNLNVEYDERKYKK